MIRAFASGDEGELWRMLRLLHPSLGEDERDAELARLDEMLRGGRHAVLVWARGDGRLGGFVEVGERDYAEGCTTKPVGYIEGWFVDADLRRQRLGARLIEAASEWARARGRTELGSGALADNQVSIAAHQRLGFSTIETQVHFLKKL